MNLNDLAAAVNAYTNGITVCGPWPTPTGWELTASTCLGNGVSVTEDGVVRWISDELPRRVKSKQLPHNVDQAAETVADLVYR